MTMPRDFLRRWKELWAWYQNQKANAPKRPQPRAGRPVTGSRKAILIKAPFGGIPARVGTRLGKASCTVLTTDVDGSENADIRQTTDEPTSRFIYNSITIPVLENGERIGHADPHDDGLYYASVGDCNDEVNE